MKTRWVRIDVRWHDRTTGALRQADQQWIEVVEHDSELLVQDDNGCHRMIPFTHLEGVRTA